MKLRIRGNSLRLRLSQKEVAQLGEQGRVEDAISFGPSKLTYVLTTSNVDHVGAVYDDHRIVVTLPKERAQKWTASDEVGIESRGEVHILVEKDWSCLKPREGEDDSDAFPHPEKTSEKK
jgi:3-methyladenine DNA glycosylase Mpg